MKGECVEDGAIRDGELVTCRFWTTVHGKHPQTGADVKENDCAIAWIPMLLIENSKVNRETGAAVESMRNTNVTSTSQFLNAMVAVAETNKRNQIK